MNVSTGGTVVAGRFRARPRERDASPFKLYVPRSRSDVVAAVREARALGQRLSVCGPGDRPEEMSGRGVVVSLERLDRILALDPSARTVTVEPGVLVDKLDTYLAEHGFGLAVAAGERTRSVGSFALLGGSGASSHRDGLFVDHLRAVEQVGSDACARTYRAEQGAAALVQRGQALPTRLTLSVMPVDKQRVQLTRSARYYARPLDFVAGSRRQLDEQPSARLRSARLIDLPLGSEGLTLGVVRAWHEQAAAMPEVGPLARRCASLLEQARARLPSHLVAGLSLLGPARASLAHAERTDDDALGDGPGTRAYRMLIPDLRYEAMFWAVYSLALAARCKEDGPVRTIAIDVARVSSTHLRRAEGGDAWALRLVVSLAPQRGGSDPMASFAPQLDAVCALHGARRLLLPTLSFAGH